jgi:hypothetical protein
MSEICKQDTDNKVLKRLNALIIRPNPPQVIGVMLDADSPSLEGRWESIKSKLRHYSYKFPDIPDIDGTIVDGTCHQREHSYAY